ncbi:hypothetical protein V1477_000977, partial [Vespula maculifrons]
MLVGTITFASIIAFRVLDRISLIFNRILCVTKPED